MAYEPVADGELVALVTFLEMRSQPHLEILTSDLRLCRWQPPMLDNYRALFRKVGAHWLWFSRLIRDDAALAAIVHDPAVHVFAVADDAGQEVGLLELDYREAGACELAFVGLVPELAGQGHGKWLLAEAVKRAWRPGVTRVHVHTCSLDHPAALSAYERAGFRPYKRALERFPDPRLLGVLPPDCAPQIPLLGTPTSAPLRPAS
ncbi:GNAT family N-acetyltransferase [Sphingomonas flavescens]|uniref:GNAT family N-acetyltransferase n=1 Tax=Sphingomonas flavescens TaxID=3132797 RepID=UPI002805EA28|nr:GNAT family N-acetyltransferase [Sphingomonas limnosediminicola]